MKGCEDCKHYCGTTYVVDHDEYGEVRETSQCARHVLATGKCKDYEPSDKAAPAPKSLAHTAKAQKPAEIEQRGPGDAQKPAGFAQGNPAAMREALKAARTLLENTDFDADSDLDDAAAPVMAQIAAALSAPARNCDRYATAKEAQAAFNATYTGPTSFGFYEVNFIRWLFDKAKEAPHA